MLIDTHAHLNFQAFEADLDDVLADARANGVEKIINVGAKLDSSASAVSLAQKYPEMYATVGVHPHHADEFDDDIYNQLRVLAKEPKVVGIGEIGLDYYPYVSETKPGVTDKNLQIKALTGQLELAHELDLPIVFHLREAKEDLLPLVAQLKKTTYSNMRAVFHCFTGDLTVAKQVLELGFYLSFTAIITYPKNDYLREVLKYTPLSSILLETDSPYLPPQSQRGLRNTPSAVKIVAESVAEIKNLDFSTVAQQTTKNAQELFKL